ncbi:MAG: hypothetical protein ABJB66_21355, partial [Gemmatimonadaceae bacterium]
GANAIDVEIRRVRVANSRFNPLSLAVDFPEIPHHPRPTRKTVFTRNHKLRIRKLNALWSTHINRVVSLARSTQRGLVASMQLTK